MEVVLLSDSIELIHCTAFYGCANDTLIYFTGNAPHISDYPYSAFLYTKTNVIGVYHPGTEGWKLPLPAYLGNQGVLWGEAHLYLDGYHCGFCSEVNPEFTGITVIDDELCYLENGTPVNYTGLYEQDEIVYYLRSCKVALNYTGLCQYEGYWFYIREGVVDWSYTGLCGHGNGWFYIRDGVLNWNYTGLCKYGNTLFYVKKGTLDWSFNGTCKYNGKTYTIKGGIAQ
jgi:hypothetical protein